jgi:hypothetical protein
MKMTLFFLLAAIVAGLFPASLAADPSGGSGSAEESYFFQVRDPSNLYAASAADGELSYPVRLTNLLRNDDSDPPVWGETVMGGIFQYGKIVDPSNYGSNWWYQGLSTDDPPPAPKEILSWSDLYGVYYRKFIQHEYPGDQWSLEVDPLMVDFKGLDDGYTLAWSDTPRTDTGFGEMRLFIPFARDSAGQVMPYTLRIYGRLVDAPRETQLSADFAGRTGLEYRAGDERASDPGICIVFSPINAKIPYPANPKPDTRTLGSQVPSSYRNREVSEYNRRHYGLYPLPDWGYAGYFYGYRDDCFDNLVPLLNKECRCRGGFDQVLCYNDDEILIMDCSHESEGSIPRKIKEETEPFRCRDHVLRIDGRIIDCCHPGEKGYVGRDIGYACWFAARNPDFRKELIINWTTGKSFDFTQDE